MKKSFFLCCFLNFSDLDQFDNSSYIHTYINLSKKFGKVFLINSEYLTFSKRIHGNYSFSKNKKYFDLIDPKNFKELNNFTHNKKIIVLNSIQRFLKNLPLLIYLNINSAKLLEISNLGNVQIGTEYFIQTKNFGSLKKTLLRDIIRKICNILSIVGVISKVDCKFTSNKKIYLDFKNKNFLQKFFTYYRNIKLVKSNIFENKKRATLRKIYCSFRFLPAL